MILTTCTNPEVLTVFLIIKKIITFLQIAAPVALVIYASIDVLKAVMAGNADEISKKLKAIPKRLIAAAVVFLVPLIVSVAVNIVDNTLTYATCLTNATEEYITSAYANLADAAVVKAEKSLKSNDYSEAITAVLKLKNQELKSNYNNRLKEVYKLIKDTTPDPIYPNVPSARETIFMGDSRTNGLAISGLISKDNCLCKDGANINDFKQYILLLKQRININPNIAYNIVLNYGINDLSHDYVSAYKELINTIDKKHNFYIVSVNPVRANSKKTGATNLAIEDFNKKLKTISRVRYCDVYSSMNIKKWDQYIDSSDIHYTKKGYNYIYSKITSCIN
ncbi:MAG: hypothetical protein RSB71_04130 [Bacilli bacterium]